MRKKISLVVLSNSGSSIKQLTISTAFLKIFFVVCLISFFILVYDYLNLKKDSFNIDGQVNKIASQVNEIKGQREQIQKFAEEITSLKNKLVELNNFEKKIRIIANIEKPDEQSLFGIGGSIPDDLETNIPLTQKHNVLLREMHEQKEQLKHASLNQVEGFQTLYKFMQDQQSLLATTPAIRPAVGWTTSRFGYRTSPFFGKREFHKGIDFANRIGTPIVATADGVVSFNGVKGGFGNVLMIDHGHGMVTRYAHCSKLLKKVGDKVKRGEKIALIGNSGRSTGPHCHYEVHLNGIPVNPDKYILD